MRPVGLETHDGRVGLDDADGQGGGTIHGHRCTSIRSYGWTGRGSGFAGRGRASFEDVHVDVVPTTWRMPAIDSLLRAFGTWAQIDTFPAEVRGAIEATVRAGGTAYETDEGLAIPNPMVLLHAGRP